MTKPTKPEAQAREIRSGAPIELRSDGDGGGIAVVGYAAVFNERTSIGDYFDEVISPGAFDEALARGDDTTFLVDHRGLPLARTTSGTLKLSVDERGLKIETELDPEDPDVARVIPKMKRGDLSKMSFAFRATKDRWDETGDTPLRTIDEVELFDVSIVTEPAYHGTEIGLRSMRAALKNVPGKAARIAARMARKARLAGLTT